MSNIFEIASRTKVRFSSTKGALSVEQLWDLPLQASNNGLSLDSLAKSTNRELAAASEDSFVAPIKNPAKNELQLKLDILKHIIGVRLLENERRRLAADRASQRERLREALARKQDASLANLSEAELQAQLDELEKE